MKLSKRSWNNVMIFACLAMIIIFNTMSDKLVDNAEGDSASVLPPQSMILTFDTPEYTIERLGRNWLLTLKKDQTSLNDIEQQQFAQHLVEYWQLASGDIVTATSDEPGYRIVVWLATEQEPRRFWIQPTVGLLTELHSQTTWQLTPNQLMQLYIALPQAIKE